MRPVLHAHCARARLRRKVQGPCEVVRVRDFRLVGTRILDLSAKGMLLETDMKILTGEELLVSFRGPSADRWYDCDGVVARVLHGRRAEDRTRALGISFEGLDPFSQMLLCEHLSAAPLARAHGRTRAKGRPHDDRRAGPSASAV